MTQTDTNVVAILTDLIEKKKSLDSSVYAFYFEGVKQSVRLLDTTYELYPKFLEYKTNEGILPELALPEGA